MLLAVSKSLPDKNPENTEAQVLDLIEFSCTGACEYDYRYEYDDGTYKGKNDRWINRGETHANIFDPSTKPDTCKPTRGLCCALHSCLYCRER